MSNGLAAYLPRDRLDAIAAGKEVPSSSYGTVLFADIAGFTPLTERLQKELGPRRGAEALTAILDALFEALCAQVDERGGIILGFAGDAMTCWFHEDVSRRGDAAAATACDCGRAMFAALEALRFAPLPLADLRKPGLKIALASGSARRFVAGDPAHCRLDLMAGSPFDRSAEGELLAHSGQFLVDEATYILLEGDRGRLEIEEPLVAETGNRYFAIASKLGSEYQPRPGSRRSPDFVKPDDALLRPWVPPALYLRETEGEGDFASEFRPCAVLFARFVGIDWNGDESEAQLDRYVRLLQSSASEQGGELLQVTIGDKGSYAYLAFGAMAAHDDDARRAARAALAIRQATRDLDFIASLQCGLSRGTLYVGTYGSRTRRVFSAIGDDVNLAARLMQLADPGTILASGRILFSLEGEFDFAKRGDVSLKGKSGLIGIAALVGEKRRNTIRIEEPRYSLPMTGRVRELEIAMEELDKSLRGEARVLRLIGEAGIGKSRLLVELLRRARLLGIVGYGGACRSDGSQAPYHPWKSLFEAFFDIDPLMPLDGALTLLEQRLERIAPGRARSLPILADFLRLPTPDNEFTRQLSAAQRQSVLHGLLGDSLAKAAADNPIVIAIEDFHWADRQSEELLSELVARLAKRSVLFVLASRPRDVGGPPSRFESLPNYREIVMSELSREEGRAAAQNAWSRFRPGAQMPTAVMDAILERAQGNPFFIEELLRWLRDREEKDGPGGAAGSSDLPESLQSLILERIDRLSEREKVTLKVASVIGRVFSAAWLPGYYAPIGAWDRVREDLSRLEYLDLTPLEQAEPELTYLFKHLVTREVAYEALPFELRGRLHERLASYLETAYPENPPLDAIAFHYGMGSDESKQALWFRKAADAAKASYANSAAIAWYDRLVGILHEGRDLAETLLLRADVKENIGQTEGAEADYRATLEMCEQLGLAAEAANAERGIGAIIAQRGETDAGLELLDRAAKNLEALGKNKDSLSARLDAAWILMRNARFDESVSRLESMLSDTRAAGLAVVESKALHYLGTIAHSRGDLAAARSYLGRSLEIKRELGERLSAANTINNLGVVEMDDGDYGKARSLLEEGLAIKRELGDAWGISSGLTNLGIVEYALGEFEKARKAHEDALAHIKDFGDPSTECTILSWLALAELALGSDEAAIVKIRKGLEMQESLDDLPGTTAILVPAALHHLKTGDATKAVRLSAATSALAAQVGFDLGKIYKNLINSISASARKTLGVGPCEVAELQGKSMDRAKALAEAWPR